MSLWWVWPVMLIVSFACLGCAGLVVAQSRRDAQAALRTRALIRHADPSRRTAKMAASPLPQRLLGQLGALVLNSGLLSRKTIAELEQTLGVSGTRGDALLARFVGAKLLMLIVLPVLAFMVLRVVKPSFSPLLPMLVFAIIGLLLPDAVVKRMRKRYLNDVERGMPIALDLLIICAEAGLSLEAGLERVASEATIASAPAANEFRITVNEMKILDDRRQALVNIGTRTGLTSAMRMSSALAQSLKYGTPLTQALRTLAAEMRQMAMTRFEEKASRIPVLLTIPMILFILPCLFVIVGGPAVVRVLQIFMHK